MKNFKIGMKIFLGFFCIFALLASIAATSIISSARTGSNISTVQLYDGLQMNANDMLHILNETRVTAGRLYEVHTEETFADISKQLMYCDYRLDTFLEYLKAYPELADFQKSVSEFDVLYQQWRNGILSMDELYTLGPEMDGEELASFNKLADNMRQTNLLAHEVLSNTTSDISHMADKKIQETRDFNLTALKIVAIISCVSFFAAILLAIIIMRSITVPMDHMRGVLDRIGQLGDLQIPEQTQVKLNAITEGRDETAQCMTALLTLVNRLHQIDNALSHVANGNLTIKIDLQSEQDTMGLAVEKMLGNLNQKFGTISGSAEWVRRAAGELSEGSQMLADGSLTQMESISHLSNAVQRVSQKTVENTDLAKKATDLVNSIQENAKLGTEKMNQMIQAASDINTSSQSISNVIKVINDIAFQTNILALNAAVEAARAGQHGKGFAVVADEVRNLATKSAEAAQNSGALIEDTMKKAEMGASIAQTTSESLQKIVLGVQQSNAIIEDIAALSNEQAADIGKITEDVFHVEQIVQQNNSIASQSAGSAEKISDQVNLLSDLVSQFQLMNNTQKWN